MDKSEKIARRIQWIIVRIMLVCVIGMAVCSILAMVCSITEPYAMLIGTGMMAMSIVSAVFVYFVWKKNKAEMAQLEQTTNV
jgi:uncharacterized membrane protein